MKKIIQASEKTFSRLKITESELKAHKIAPSNLLHVESDEGLELQVDKPKRVVVKKAEILKKFNSTKFVEKFHEAMKDKVVGYAFQIRKNGAPHQTIIWNWSRTHADGGKGWTLDTRMHIASVSKMITGIAIYNLLLDKGISVDALIHSYLPSYWTKGPNVSQITFRHLLNHTSGFNTGDSKSDFSTMKSMVKNGVALTGDVSLGKGKYANMNFGLCRILIPIINGDISKNEDYKELTQLGINIDVLWDAFSIAEYKDYVQKKVLTPAGVASAGFNPRPLIDAIAYKFPATTAKGWDSGKLGSMSGGAAWRLSINEVLQVMHHVKRKGTILTSTQAEYLLENSLGLDWDVETPAGKWYSKNGRLVNSSRTEQCVAAFLPGGYEMVIFVNSPIGSQGEDLMTKAYETFLSSLD
ncbi:serine hydrolase domain-containing protein [Algoriphagus aquimarinus]|uniref:serine hydrolase domain-containing protein n=1 Tax=Algoriphagus aquimarinus TaxID=237018 RepID=UPI0030D76EF5|tara:strand:- start:133423 stop:134658 length:1236 start_codon:yes stop_codon:yes gene_type:complete